MPMVVAIIEVSNNNDNKRDINVDKVLMKCTLQVKVCLVDGNITISLLVNSPT